MPNLEYFYNFLENNFEKLYFFQPLIQPPKTDEWIPWYNKEYMSDRFCGTYFPEGMQKVHPEGSKVKIIFNSDASIEKPGFLLKMGAFKSERKEYVPPGEHHLKVELQKTLSKLFSKKIKQNYKLYGNRLFLYRHV